MNRTEEKLKKDFGIHLKKLRMSKNMTLRDLDAASGIDFSTIGKIESGIRNTYLQDLFALAKGLDIDVLDLITF